MPKIFEEETIVIIQEIVSGDTDVDYIDSFDLADSLAGTLGPVNAIDSLDISDELKVSEFNAQDSTDISDELDAIYGPVVGDSLDLADQLSGTLGPVNAQDSFDVSELLRLDEFNAQDSLDVADQLSTDGFGTDLDDSLDFADQLSGTLGPVNAQDSTDIADVLDIDSALVQDSVDISDAPDGDWSITATQPDSLAISDQASNITQLDDDSLTMWDALYALNLTAQESADFADSLYAVRLAANDSLDVSDVLYQTITGPRFPETLNMADSFGTSTEISDDSLSIADAFYPTPTLTPMVDSVDVSDAPKMGTFTATEPEPIDFGESLFSIRKPNHADSLDIGDAKSTWTLANTQQWPNAAPTTTGFTSPANGYDVDNISYAYCSATGAAGFLGVSFTNVTTNGTLVVSWPDPVFSPTSFTSVTLRYKYSTGQSLGTLPSGAAVSMALAYSINDGGAYTTIKTITNVATGDLTETVDLAGIVTSWTHVQQFRFRCTGSVSSGTSTLSASTQEFRFYFARLEITAVWA